MTTTITRLFDNYADAAAVVGELQTIGISHDDISLVSRDADTTGTLGASNAVIGAGANDHHDDGHAGEGLNDHGDITRGASAGAAIGGVGGLLAGLGLMAIPGIGPIVAAGWLVATAAGAGLGAAGGAATGGVVGALKNSGHSDEEAHVYSEGLRRGGTLVSVKTDESQAEDVRRLLERHNGVDASHRGTAYRAAGWTQYDDSAPGYDRSAADTERQSYTRKTTF